MAAPSGIAAQLGFKEETVWGTAVTVDRFVPLVSESLTNEIERLESEAIIAGARLLRSQQWSAGGIAVAGDVELELYDRSVGMLFKHMFGSVVTAGAGPYTHTCTPGSMTGLGLTVQVGRPDVGGTVRPFTFAGCKVASWSLECSAGEIAKHTLSLVGKSETTGTALATASYASGIKPMTFVGGAVSLGGSSVNCKGFTLEGDNGLATERMFLGSQYVAEPLEENLREYSGTVELEFESLTQYAHYTAGDELAAVFTLASGASTVVVTTNVRYDGESPQVGGREILTQSIPVKVLGTTSDASGITAVVTNTDSTP